MRLPSPPQLLPLTQEYLYRPAGQSQKSQETGALPSMLAQCFSGITRPLLKRPAVQGVWALRVSGRAACSSTLVRGFSGTRKLQDAPRDTR